MTKLKTLIRRAIFIIVIAYILNAILFTRSGSVLFIEPGIFSVLLVLSIIIMSIEVTALLLRRSIK